MAGCSKKLSAVGRKGSRDGGVDGVRQFSTNRRESLHYEAEEWGHSILSLSQDDSRVVREGDKVYVIKQYAVEEEDNSTEQPRCLALVGFIMCTSLLYLCSS